ncbi:retrovirus-related pol polyprotein from transposon TNT 1-94 [Tanacetum coccineum]
MAFLTAIASSRFPLTNNQLRTSSNPRNQASIQDGRVTVQQVQGRQGQSYSGTGYKSNATSSGGNNTSGHARVVKCYNCQGSWTNLDEEQLAFLADLGVPNSQALQTIIPNNAAFQTEDLDTYDSSCDDISNAKAVLMANISNYGFDVILELRMSNPSSKPSDASPVKIEAPKELPKIRTTADAHTEGEWGFEHTKSVFNNETILFLKSLKDIFNVFDRDLLNEIMKVQTVFDQMDADVQQSSVDKQCLEIAKKELLLGNDLLLQQIMSQDVLLTMMNSMSLFGESVNMDRKRKESCDKCFNLEAELLKSQNAHNDLLKSYSQLEKHCISLELSIQLNQEIFQKDESCNNQNALEILEFFENNDLKAQLQDKDSTICKLKDIIKSMREKSKEENVKYDYGEIETKNVELENSVAKLISENERLCNEINHVKQVFKEQFDSIKKTRVRTKEHSDSLIDKLNLKSAENEDLKAQIQDKVFVITSLKNDLRKVKGKEIVDIAAQIPSANTIVPGMFKLDLEPLAPRLLQNREAHIDYLKYTQEQADILREIVKQAKAKQPLDKELDFACKHAQRIQELLVYVQDTCPNAIKLNEKKVAVTPKNKIKKVRFAEPLTSSSKVKHVESSKTSNSNTPVLSPTRLKCSTSNFGSKHTSNKKNDRISRTTSKNIKNKVKAQPRKFNKKNHVVEPIRDVDVKHSLLNANSEPICATCKKSMFDGVHDMCTDRFGNENIARIMGSRNTNLYTISLDDMLKTSPICLLSKASKTKSWLWHRRLLHLNFGTLNKLAKDCLVRGIPRLKFQKDHLCFACALGKSQKSSHQPKAEDTNQEKLYLLHMDLCGPMRVTSINGKIYILVIVDDYLRFTWVRFLRLKEEAPNAIVKCIKNIQVRLNAIVRNVRTDNGTEFVNQTLREFYENVGIWHQTSVSRTLQQNGVVERRNRTLVEAAHKKLDLSFFHVFGALCYPTNDNDDMGKLDAKADIGIFVGYAPAKKAFRIYNKRTRKIIETIHVTFDELTAMGSEQFSSGPGLHFMTPATSSSRLVPNFIPQQPCIPPPRDDWDRLFQPMFDEYFTPPSIDAPSTSTPSTQEQEHSPIISQGFEESPKTPTFCDDLLHESLHKESTS